MPCTLPKTQTFIFYDPEPSEWSMEFRLIYQGPLPPERWSYREEYARAADKHRLRKYFHRQLKELWSQHPDLRRQADQQYFRAEGGMILPVNIARVHISGSNPVTIMYNGMVLPNARIKTWLEHIADDHIACNGNRFIPLVSKASGFTCSLNILFLRRDNPGALIESSGDIDSRIKVLFDGLKMPTQVAELGGFPIDDDEKPFHVLLEDDKLVTSVSVTTDRLIVPQGSQENINDVLLITHVTVVNPGAIFAGGRLV